MVAAAEGEEARVGEMELGMAAATSDQVKEEVAAAEAATAGAEAPAAADPFAAPEETE